MIQSDDLLTKEFLKAIGISYFTHSSHSLIQSSSSFYNCAAFRYSPEFTIDSYPGHPPGSPLTLRHSLAMHARNFLIYHITLTNPHVKRVLVRFDHEPDSVLTRGTNKVELAPVPGVRLFGRKVVSQAGELSAGEYASLAGLMASFAELRPEWRWGSKVWAMWNYLRVMSEVLTSMPEMLEMELPPRGTGSKSS